MLKALSEDEFLEAVRGFRRSAFRLETRGSYALDYEQDEFARFLAGHPRPPTEIEWWSPWLERVRQFGREGRRISRIRILAEPPTDYQRWMLWADPWHIAAGEDIRYLSRQEAWDLGLPLGSDADWWLLDDERVIIMAFDEDGSIRQKTLVDDPPELLDRYRAWRAAALAHAVPATRITAA